MKNLKLYSRKCDTTNKGMNKGWYDENSNDKQYFKKKEDILKHIKKVIKEDTEFLKQINLNLEEVTEDRLFDLAFNHFGIYWTEWEELDEVDEAFDIDGCKYVFENGEWVKEINLDEDYEICGGNGIDVEEWKHRNTGEIISIDILITRSYNGKIIE